MAQQHEPDPGPGLGIQFAELLVVVDDGHERRVDVGTIRADDLVTPMAPLRRADPQCTVDAERLGAESAPADEGGLAGQGA